MEGRLSSGHMPISQKCTHSGGGYLNTGKEEEEMKEVRIEEEDEENDGARDAMSPSRKRAKREDTVTTREGGAACVDSTMTGFSRCGSIDSYKKLNKISEGTYGVVYRAQNKATEEIVALKQIKLVQPTEGFPQTSLREIQLLLRLKHPNIVHVHEIVRGKTTSHIFMVMNYMEHELQKLLGTMKTSFKPAEVKTLVKQLCSALQYLHSNWVVHRDVKSSNLLFSNRGVLKLCDFGLARSFGRPFVPYTSNIVTLWYRSPEILLAQKVYDPTAVDVWSAGCVFWEIMDRRPLFPGKTECEQLQRIFALTGVPTGEDDDWPEYPKLCQENKKKFPTFKAAPARWQEKVASLPNRTLSQSGFDLLQNLLRYDPLHRLTATQALDSVWFVETPAALSDMMMPTFKDTNSQIREQATRSFIVPVGSMKNSRHHR